MKGKKEVAFFKIVKVLEDQVLLAIHSHDPTHNMHMGPTQPMHAEVSTQKDSAYWHSHTPGFRATRIN